MDLNNTYTQGIHILTPSDDIILSSKNKDNDNIFKNDDEKIYQTFQTLRFDSNSSFKNTTFNDTINLSSDITNQLPETSINNFQIGNNHLPNTMNFFSKSYANTSSPRLAPHRRQIYSIFQNKNLRGKDDNNDYVDSSNVEIYLSQGSGCLQIDEDSNTYKKINYGTSSPNVWVLRNNKQIENYQKTPSNLNDSDSTTQTNSFNSSNLYDKSLNCQKDNSMPMNVSSQGSSFLKNKDYEKNDYNSYRSDNTG